jgi:hypothetical protein
MGQLQNGFICSNRPRIKYMTAKRKLFFYYGLHFELGCHL